MKRSVDELGNRGLSPFLPTKGSVTVHLYIVPYSSY